MRDLKNIAAELASISAGNGPTNWALLTEDATTKELKIVDKGTNGLPELRQALTTSQNKSERLSQSAAQPKRDPLVGYMNHNNIPLKLRLMDSKDSRALAKHHDVKVLMKNHVAVLDVEDVMRDLRDENVDRVIESVSPVTSPTGGAGGHDTARDEGEEILETELNRAFEQDLKLAQTVRSVNLEKWSRASKEIEKEQQEMLAAKLKTRANVNEWAEKLKQSGATMFEGWVGVRLSETAPWKNKWVVIQDKKLTIYRDELKKATVASYSLGGAKVENTDEAMRNSFQIIIPLLYGSGAAFYTDFPDTLSHVTAAIELSAV
ncbi:hypothetical protein BJ741DRAFT_591002 [Chytriomyces cf. hyalinus JEL632]|nr:hypothetical protein BJ741DRAFT_591002 [Chytriomyces cf. hyalinus JEL632]